MLLFYDQDHMRRAGDVCFSQVFRDRGGKWNWLVLFCMLISLWYLYTTQGNGKR